MTISQGEQIVVVTESQYINLLSFEGETLILDGHETFVFHWNLRYWNLIKMLSYGWQNLWRHSKQILYIIIYPSSYVMFNTEYIVPHVDVRHRKFISLSLICMLDIKREVVLLPDIHPCIMHLFVATLYKCPPNAWISWN